MAENTPNSFLPLGNTTEELAGLHGKEKQLVVDTTKNTLVVMDGETPGGHPLAKEGTKIKSGSEDVIINDSTEATLAGDVTIKNKPWGVVLDGEFPTDEEELAELANRVPVGGSVYGLAPLGPEDAIPAPYNTEEIITESGTWTAPVTGYFEVMCINGGDGGLSRPHDAIGGISGNITKKLKYYQKGTTVGVVIGSGGIGDKPSSVTGGSDARSGGVTSFGEITGSDDAGTSFRNNVTYDMQYYIGGTTGIPGGRAVGAGFGGGDAWTNTADSDLDAIGHYGGGGGAMSESSTSKRFAGNGAPGCIIIRYYDPSKDTSLSIGDQLVTDLVARIEALEAKIKE